MDDDLIDAMAARLERLERENRRWRWAGALAVVATAGLVCIGTMWPRVVEARQSAPLSEEAKDSAALVEDQLQLTRRALKIIEQTETRGAMIPNPVTQVYEWSTRSLAAQIYLSMSKDEPKTQNIEVYLSLAKCEPKAKRVAAFEDHLARMRHWENKFRPLVSSGKLSVLDYLHIQTNRLQAETWLARERLKFSGGPSRTP
jgi:hypothetical protein